MPHIAILTANHLCHNPRVLKEADTLSAAGYTVEVLGAWFDSELAARDKQLIANRSWLFTPVVDWTTGAAIAGMLAEACRFRSWVARQLYEHWNWESDGQLGYCARELFSAAKNLNADLYIAHSEPAMWAAVRLQNEGRRVGVDMEDWFLEDLLPEVRKHRPLRLLSELERSLLCMGGYRLCPSQAMSQALARRYGCRPPTVIYNSFLWKDRQLIDGNYRDRKNRDIPSIHWYSQSLGHGRGLEDLLAALQLVTHRFELHLRGTPVSGFAEWLDARVSDSLRRNIYLHPLVSNQELLSRIAEHDIGFAGEMKYSQSRNLTVTNKILQYLLGGLAVVASDTDGQREVAELAAGAVAIYRSGDPASLASQLNSLLDGSRRLLDMKEAAIIAAKTIFCWEAQEARLVQCANEAVQ